MQTTTKIAIGLVHGFPVVDHSPQAVPVSCGGLLIGHIDAEYVDEITRDAAAATPPVDLEIGGVVAHPRSTGLAAGVVHSFPGQRGQTIVVNGRETSCLLSACSDFVTMADKYSEMTIDVEAIDETVAALLRIKEIASKK